MRNLKQLLLGIALIHTCSSLERSGEYMCKDSFVLTKRHSSCEDDDWGLVITFDPSNYTYFSLDMYKQDAVVELDGERMRVSSEINFFEYEGGVKNLRIENIGCEGHALRIFFVSNGKCEHRLEKRTSRPERRLLSRRKRSSQDLSPVYVSLNELLNGVVWLQPIYSYHKRQALALAIGTLFYKKPQFVKLTEFQKMKYVLFVPGLGITGPIDLHGEGSEYTNYVTGAGSLLKWSHRDASWLVWNFAQTPGPRWGGDVTDRHFWHRTNGVPSDLPGQIFEIEPYV